ncbi:hypothetical protein OS493_005264 [Desmophyllum pertusum]|uniref:SCP domain-containing protein n=1 Tax=Desmophyllum pertusum TaxID=174260 RepID=A0A9X0CTF7_9CNID|nr:hypothetical protein OS493_005264 [Desmophyllum pertusum]
MREIIWIFAVFTILKIANGQVYGGYQYRPPYPYVYKMAPVYSWYQRDKKPSPDVQIEPNSEDTTAFEAQGILYTNLHRHVHNTPGLQLDHQLSLQAARYAQKVAENLVIKHSPIQSRPGQGENIFLRCKAFSQGVSAFEAVKEWYSTVCHWDFDNRFL